MFHEYPLAIGADRQRSDRRATEPIRPPPVLLVVEGRYDIEFLRRISAILASESRDLPNLSELEQQGRLIFVPAGGEFELWLDRLSSLGCPEVHILDREVPPITAQRQVWIEQINRRPGCRAFLTGKRALENYLHPAAIADARGLRLVFGTHDDVAELAARAALVAYAPAAWETLGSRARRRLRNLAKSWLNTKAVDCMTVDRLAEQDHAGEVRHWLASIGGLANGP